MFWRVLPPGATIWTPEGKERMPAAGDNHPNLLARSAGSL
jgi:hypothetical protein